MVSSTKISTIQYLQQLIDYHSVNIDHLKFCLGINSIVSKTLCIFQLVVSQAIKHKLRGNKSKFYVESASGVPPSLDETLHEDEKARMLLGDHSAADHRSSKKGLQSRKPKKKS